MKNNIQNYIVFFCFLSIAFISNLKAQLVALEPNLSGKYEITAGAGGSNADPYDIYIRKPRGATTVYKIFMYNTGSVNGNPLNVIRVDNNNYNFSSSQLKTVNANIEGTNYTFRSYSGEVAGAMRTKLNNAPANSTIQFSVSEGNKTVETNGVGIVVIWNNPTKPVGSHFVYMGIDLIKSAPNGTSINIPISPIDKSIPNFEPILGIGISHSTGTVNDWGTQWSVIKVNNQTLTEKAGGFDDGYNDVATNGELITLGGYGDDPNNNDEDELYNIKHLLQGGEKQLRFNFTDVDTTNDDFVNVIYFSGIGVTPTVCNLIPPTTQTPIRNVCPSQTVNLNTQGLAESLPLGAQVRWYRNSPIRTSANLVANPAQVGAGTYYAFYYDSDLNCWSEASGAVNVEIINCATCTNSGETSVNLNDVLGSNSLSPNVVVEWWTTPNREINTKVSNPTAVTESGYYYAFFYDTVANCYNTNFSTAMATVNILPQCNNTCVKPGVTGSPAGFTKVGITVQQKQETWPGNIPNGHIALESKTKGFVITRVNHVSTVPAPSDSIADPKEGMVVYDIVDKCVKLFNGTNWTCIQRTCNDSN